MSTREFRVGKTYFESFPRGEVGLPSRDMSAAMCNQHKGLSCKALPVLPGNGATGCAFDREVHSNSDFPDGKRGIGIKRYEIPRAGPTARGTMG